MPMIGTASDSSFREVDGPTGTMTQSSAPAFTRRCEGHICCVQPRVPRPRSASEDPAKPGEPVGAPHLISVRVCRAGSITLGCTRLPLDEIDQIPEWKLQIMHVQA